MKSTLSIEPERIYEIYEDMADKVLADEESLQDSLPIDTTVGVSTHLTELVDRWDDGRKSLRTTPTVNVYTNVLNSRLDESILRVLVALDAQINVLDDIIDIKDLPTEERVGLTANAAFASTLIADATPPAHRESVTTFLREYFTALFQIPLVEDRLFEKMRNATTATVRREAAQSAYAYRARGMDAFAEIPAIMTGVDKQTKEQLSSDLRAYRARHLIFKDVYDIPRDLTDDDMTPVIALLTTHASAETVTAEIEHIYDQFEYTTQGQEQYGSVLNELENSPSDLNDLLKTQQEHIDKAVD